MSLPYFVFFLYYNNNNNTILLLLSDYKLRFKLHTVFVVVGEDAPKKYIIITMRAVAVRFLSTRAVVFSAARPSDPLATF